MVNRMKPCGSTEQNMVGVVAALLLFVAALQPVCGVALTSAQRQRRAREGSVSGLVAPQGNGSAPEVVDYCCSPIKCCRSVWVWKFLSLVMHVLHQLQP